MAVRIRLTRFGRRHRPFYRIGVFDSNTRRDGRYLENLGTYDPIQTDRHRQVTVNRERLQHWLGQGAQMTESVRSILKATDKL